MVQLIITVHDQGLKTKLCVNVGGLVAVALHASGFEMAVVRWQPVQVVGVLDGPARSEVQSAKLFQPVGVMHEAVLQNVGFARHDKPMF